MRVLVIGGTRFVGRHIAQAFAANGDRVTLFNRGVTGPAPAPEIEEVHGDRAADLHALDGQSWDAVIDTCGYTPGVVEISAKYFAEKTGRYVFISTISVYDIEKTESPNEDSPLARLPHDADRTAMTPETYGALKVLCEEALLGTFANRATILRPGLVAGPHDPTDRFTYWPVRIEAGGEVLAPESASEPIQYIDARDLAAFAVRVASQSDGGIFNCVTPKGSLTFGDLLAGATATWVDAAFLRRNEVSPWGDLPLWIPSDDPARGLANADSGRALARGLRNRPIAETMRDTLAWAVPAGKRCGGLKAGLAPARERVLLEQYRGRLTSAVE